METGIAKLWGCDEGIKLGDCLTLGGEGREMGGRGRWEGEGKGKEMGGEDRERGRDGEGKERRRER